MIDWSAAINTQDKSLEALMAKRDLEKQMGLLTDVARLSETKRQHGVEAGLEGQKIAAENARAAAVREDVKAQREAAQKNIDLDNKRAQQALMLGKLKPGDRITDPGVVGAVRENEGGNQLTPDASDPTAFLYRQHEFEVAQSKAKLEEALRQQQMDDRKVQMDNEKQRLAMEAQRVKLEEANGKRADARATQIQADHDKRQKMLDHQLEQMPVDVREQAKAQATKETKSAAQGFWEADDAYASRLHSIQKDVYDRFAKEATAAGRMKAPSDVPAPQAAPPVIRYDMNGHVIKQ